MDNLIYCLNATVPIFLTLMLGYFFRRIGMFDAAFVSKMNGFVFKASLPALVFIDLCNTDFASAWNTKFVVFCFLATLLSITISFIVSYLIKASDIQGEFIQASYRSSAAILGIAVIQNIYGNSGMGPLMIIASVPLYNIMAVVVLSFFHPDSQGINREQIRKTLIGIAKNPIILGILAGMIWSLLKIPLPTFAHTTINNLAKTATPLGLMAMGGALEFNKLFSRIKPAIICCFLKLIGFEILFLPIAILLGFSGSELVAIIIMLGSATTVSCHIMAKNIGHEGVFTSSVVMITTLLSSFTLTLWLFICRTLGII